MKNLTLEQVKNFMNEVNVNHMLNTTNFTCPAHLNEKLAGYAYEHGGFTYKALMLFINELSITNLEALETYIINNH